MVKQDGSASVFKICEKGNTKKISNQIKQECLMSTNSLSDTQRPIASLVFYLTVNTIHHPHKDQPVDAVQDSTH